MMTPLVFVEHAAQSNIQDKIVGHWHMFHLLHHPIMFLSIFCPHPEFSGKWVPASRRSTNQTFTASRRPSSAQGG